MVAHILITLVLSVLAFAGGTPPAPTPTPAPTSTPIPPEPATYAPILMYHKIGGGNGRYSVSVEKFAAQMKWLKENGYETVSVDQIAAAVRGQAALPPKPIAITFDDGWRNQFTLAKPILDQYGFKATFYLVTNYLSSTTTFMSWQDVAVLNAEGHWIGSHSVSHASNTRLNAAQLTFEITKAETCWLSTSGNPSPPMLTRMAQPTNLRKGWCSNWGFLMRWAWFRIGSKNPKICITCTALRSTARIAWPRFPAGSPGIPSRWRLRRPQ